MFLDLSDAFGSVPHNLLWSAFDYFQVSAAITGLVKAYFQDRTGRTALCINSRFHHSVATPRGGNHGQLYDLPTGPHHGHGGDHPSISVGGWRTAYKTRLRLPPIRAYIDDLTTLTTTTLTTTKACTLQLLAKLQRNNKLARMKIKLSKSRSIPIVEGKLVDVHFQVGSETIPSVSKKQVKSLGRWYTASLKDTEQADQLRKDAASGLESTNKYCTPWQVEALVHAVWTPPTPHVATNLI